MHVTTTNAAARSTVDVQGDTAVVTVTAEDGTTTGTYRVTVARPTLTLAAHGTLTPGSTVTVEAGGMTPGAVYEVVVHSTPQVLGHVTAAQDGTVRASVTLPADLVPGAHTLFLADAAGDAVSDPLAPHRGRHHHGVDHDGCDLDGARDDHGSGRAVGRDGRHGRRRSGRRPVAAPRRSRRPRPRRARRTFRLRARLRTGR